MKSIPLGKKIKTTSIYNPGLLFPISRKEYRDKINIKNIYFNGYDIWNAYELSWLSNNGKPEVRILQIVYSSNSDFIIESKSLKLYLNSFNMSKFSTENEVKEVITKDLNKILKTSFLQIKLSDINKKIKYSKIPDKLLLDNLDIKTDSYEINKLLLKKNKNKETTIERFSNLLRTNCPVTNQPDWATIFIKYRSNYFLEDVSLLKYIISFREHSDFHESCCERIFNDIYLIINPLFLIVKCFYTRRGGIDINPARFYGINPDNEFDFHYLRQ